MDMSPLFITLKVAVMATTSAAILGITAAFLVMETGKYKGFIDGIFTIPMVLPPSVQGFFLLMLIGRNGPIGKLLSKADLSIIFTWKSAVIAATIAAFPLMYRTVRSSFEQLNDDWINTAKTLSMSRLTIFWKIMLPNSINGVLAGIILSFARAMGEFGATMMLAGNIPGKTQTIALAIYSAVQNGNNSIAYFWTAVIVSLSFFIIVILNGWILGKGSPQKETGIC
jgi:molybdate transport system permease protein